VRVLRQGETLYNEGDDGTEMSFLVAGRLWVNVLRFGAANPVKTLETGSVMGEEALLLEDQRHYGTIVAAETSVVFVLVLDALQEVLEDFAQVRALIQSRVLLSSDANQIRVLVHALRSTIQHELSVTARTPTPPPLARIGSNFIVNRFASRKLSRERFSSHAHNSGDLDHNELDKRWEAIQVAGRRHAAMLSALAHTLATKPERRLKTMNRFDVFLSYRVASDAELAQLLYYRLRVQGVRVWWDKECLEVGQSWVEGFSNGLAACRYFVVLMSEAALAPLTQLHDCSPCDNVLLEMQMALELKEKGRLSGLQPVLVGRREMSEYGAELFTDFFKSGCLPAGGFPNIEVASVSAALSTHFSRVANTQPSRMRTVSETVNEVLQNQGTFFLGQRDHALRIVVDDILKSCKPVTDTHVDPHARSHHHHAESTPKESVGLEFEHQQ